jgi:transcriptional repressor NrdR
VVKRDGSRVPFCRENIMQGVLAACGKRAIAEEAKEGLVDEVDEALHREFDREVASHVIGERVLQRLYALDEVAFIRFASEYYQFTNVSDIMAELEALNGRVRDVKDQQSLFLE